MESRKLKALSGAVVAVTLISVGIFLALRAPRSRFRVRPRDNEALTKLFQEDQADRTPDNIDWSVVGPRDEAREARAKELYFGNMLGTASDYYHIAMILQHANSPDDYMLAHELCVAAIIKGSEDAKWLAAASEDRFLMSLDRPQRFGTQYQSKGPSEDFRLYKMEPGVTDAVRGIMNVPRPRD
ncbi:MAG: hypothetical protein ACREDR_13130 [Blastocatellia bacterium]